MRKVNLKEVYKLTSLKKTSKSSKENIFFKCWNQNIKPNI